MTQKILLIDVTHQVPLGREFACALKTVGAKVSYISSDECGIKPAYYLRRRIHKHYTRYRHGRKTYTYFPKCDLNLITKKIATFQPDIVLFVGFSYSCLSAKDLMNLKSRFGFKSALWDTDSANHFDQVEMMKFFIHEELPRHDLILSFSKAMSDYFKTLGLNGHYLPFAANRALALRPEVQPSYKHDVTFIGRSGPRRLFLLNNLAQTQKITVYGARWSRFLSLMSENLKQQCITQDIHNDALYEVLTSSRLVMNITNAQFFSLYTGINLRIFEAIALRCCLISESSNELNSLLKPDIDYISFDSNEMLLDKAEYYLKHDEAREKIALQGYKTLLDNHTWEHRATDFLDLVTPTLSES